MDLIKALDFVDHNTLLHKLGKNKRSYGIRGKALDWLKLLEK